MKQMKRSESSRLLSAASAGSVEEPVVYRVTAPPARYLFPLKRAFSVSELYSGANKTASNYSPHYGQIYHTYCRDWDLGNDYRHDHRYEKPSAGDHVSLGWPHYSRYHPDYPKSWYPASFRHHSTTRPTQSSSTGSRYNVDYFDSFYWKSRLDPYSVGAFPGRNYAPWSFRPQAYEKTDTSGAVRMYRQGLIGYDTFEKYWIKPRAWYNHYLGNL